MLKSIEIKGYRCFEQYRVEGLSRVNLLVGKNNCGKTALLEAIWLAVTEGDLRVLFDIAERRGELKSIQGYNVQYTPSGTFVDHFFHGHAIEHGTLLSISSSGQSGEKHFVSYEIIDAASPQVSDDKQSMLQEEYSGLVSCSLLKINSYFFNSSLIFPLLLDKEQAKNIVLGVEQKRFKGKEIPSVRYIFPEWTRAGSLSAIWNGLLSDGRETDVVDVLKTLAPDIKAIHFLSEMNHYLNLASDSVIVVFESGERVPLGTLGDGMRYLLGLAISLVQADGGVLLIDEIDTGLHYSVMGDLWKLVVETAKKRDIQVFATTHSQDCVRGLAWLCDKYPNLKQEVSLQKIDPEIEKAVDVDGDGIVLAVDQRIEVR